MSVLLIEISGIHNRQVITLHFIVRCVAGLDVLNFQLQARSILNVYDEKLENLYIASAFHADYFMNYR